MVKSLFFAQIVKHSVFNNSIKINHMPELPEVQTTVNGINRSLKGLKIVDVWTDYPVRDHDHKKWSISNGVKHQQIKNQYYFKEFKKTVVGAKIVKAERRAKNILIYLSNDQVILVHMKMTGHLLYGKYEKKLKNKNGKFKNGYWQAKVAGPLRDDPYNQFIHLVFTLSNQKQLALSDVRKFAKVTIFPVNKLPNYLSHLGPEPLDEDFGTRTLKDRLAKKPTWKIKLALMDQTVISGIGNIYSDEILWASNIHPESQVQSLKTKDLNLILKNIKKILRKGIDFSGDSMSDYRNIDGNKGGFQNEHNVYRKKGIPCSKPGCKGIIERRKVGGRSAHFCPVHQSR